MKHRSSTFRAAYGLGSALRIAGALALMGVFAPNAIAAAAPIYKCFDKSLSVVYTDLPCKDGEVVDIRPGSADPAALARLERERDALDRSSAQRVIDLRRAELDRSIAQANNYYPAYAPDYAGGYDGDSYADYGGFFPYGYGVPTGAGRNRSSAHDRPFDRRGARQHVVPNAMAPSRR